MTAITKLEIRILVVLVLLGVGAGVYQVHKDSVDSVSKMQATIATLEGSRKDEQQTLAATLQGIAATEQATVTPAQVIRELPTVITLPAPIVPQPQPSPSTVASGGGSMDTTNPTNSPTKLGSDDAGDAIIPQADLKPLFDRLADCKACEAKSAEQATEITQLTKERDDAVQTAKGGSFWRRFKHDAKVIAIGGAVGFVAGLAASHKGL